MTDELDRLREQEDETRKLTGELHRVKLDRLDGAKRIDKLLAEIEQFRGYNTVTHKIIEDQQSEIERLRIEVANRAHFESELQKERERLRGLVYAVPPTENTTGQTWKEACEANREEVARLRGLVYAYPPSEPYAPDGITWQQEAEEAQRQSCQCGEDEACKYMQENERLRQANVTWAHDTIKLTTTIKYLIGIAERGEGREINSNETAEGFVLAYVKKLESEIERLRARLNVSIDSVEGMPTGYGEDEVDRLQDEVNQLSGVIDRAAKAWISLGPIAGWRGDVGDAMGEAVRTIVEQRVQLKRLRGRVDELSEEAITLQNTSLLEENDRLRTVLNERAEEVRRLRTRADRMDDEADQASREAWQQTQEIGRLTRAANVFEAENTRLKEYDIPQLKREILRLAPFERRHKDAEADAIKSSAQAADARALRAALIERDQRIREQVKLAQDLQTRLAETEKALRVMKLDRELENSAKTNP